MKTKTIILALFVIIFVCEHAQAQEELPYRSFQTFKRDTIQYLDYNFTIRSDQYTDKTIEDFFRDLELPIVYVDNVMLQSRLEKSGVDIVAMNLVIRPIRTGNEDGVNSKKDYYIRIGLKTPLDAGEFVDALDYDKRNSGRDDLYYWTPQLYEALKKIEISGVESNPYLFKDRQKLLENYSVENWKKLRLLIEAEKTNWRKRILEEKQSKKLKR